MKKVKLGDVTINLDSKRKPLNNQDRKKISVKKLYPYCGANKIMDYVDEYIFDEEIICIAEDGGKWGKNELCSYIMNERCWVNNHVHVLKCNGNININYLKYWLNFNDLNYLITGAIVRKLTQKALCNIEIELPDIKKQISIAKKLDKVQEIIDLRKKQIEELEELIRAQFVDMFGDIYDNKNNYIIKELDYYTSMITYGLTIRPKFVEMGIDLISAREINSGNIDYDKAPKISEDDYNKLSDKAKPKKNEILFSKTGTIGLCAIIDSEIKFAITQNAARIVPKENINPIWLLYYLRTDEIQSYCKRQAKGNAVKDFQIQDMKKIPILDCSISKQNEFVEKVKQIDKQKIILKKSLKETEELQESLMNKYFGE